MNMMDEVRDFLEKNNLNHYADKFLYLGYDDMTQLQEMPSHELAYVMKEIGIFERPGHRKRFISALQILNSKSKHGHQRLMQAVLPQWQLIHMLA